MDYRIIHSNGNVYWVNDTGHLIHDETNGTQYLDGLILNITKRKKGEEILKQTYDELKTTTRALKKSNAELMVALEEAKRSRELEKALDQLKKAQSQLIHSEKMAMLGILSNGVAHEINNPLNFIHGARLAIADYIKDHLSSQQIQALVPLLDMIKTGVDRSSDIIRSLTHFSQTSSNKEEICNLASIIDNSLIILNNQIQSKIKVQKAYAADVIEIKGNKGELHQVFLNILLNAVQAISGTGTISISLSVQDDFVITSIKDTGCGISQENLVKLTNPFFTTKPPGEGSGLGLSISYKLLQEHHGNIEFQSQINKGTTVIVTLPIYKHELKSVKAY